MYNWEESLDLELVRRLRRPLTPGVISLRVARRLLDFIQYLEGRLSLLDDLARRRGGKDKSIFEAAVPIVHARWAPFAEEPAELFASKAEPSRPIVHASPSLPPASSLVVMASAPADAAVTELPISRPERPALPAPSFASVSDPAAAAAPAAGAAAGSGVLVAASGLGIEPIPAVAASPPLPTWLPVATDRGSEPVATASLAPSSSLVVTAVPAVAEPLSLPRRRPSSTDSPPSAARAALTPSGERPGGGRTITIDTNAVEPTSPASRAVVSDGKPLRIDRALTPTPPTALERRPVSASDETQWTVLPAARRRLIPGRHNPVVQSVNPTELQPITQAEPRVLSGQSNRIPVVVPLAARVDDDSGLRAPGRVVDRIEASTVQDTRRALVVTPTTLTTEGREQAAAPRAKVVRAVAAPIEPKDVRLDLGRSVEPGAEERRVLPRVRPKAPEAAPSTVRATRHLPAAVVYAAGAAPASEVMPGRAPLLTVRESNAVVSAGATDRLPAGHTDRIGSAPINSAPTSPAPTSPAPTSTAPASPAPSVAPVDVDALAEKIQRKILRQFAIERERRGGFG